MNRVKSYEGRIGLEWVMNSSLSLTLNTHGKVSLTEFGWAGWVTPDSADDRSCLYWGSPYTVRLGDEHTFEADVGEPGEDGVFPLWEWGTRPQPSPPCPDCQTPMRWAGTYMAGPEPDGTSNIFECPACAIQRMRANTAQPWARLDR
jgi:hypothetical protein